jgi:hypothetical protein
VRIGLFVEDTVDEYFIRGLGQRWCPHLEIVPAHYRGATRQSLAAQLPKALLELFEHKQCEVVVYLTDANNDKWHDRRNNELKKIPENRKAQVIIGIPVCNIECWLAADRQAIARFWECREEEIPTDDPSSFIDKRLGLRKERLIGFVADLPSLHRLLEQPSFENFYANARAAAKQNNCQFRDERQ